MSWEPQNTSAVLCITVVTSVAGSPFRIQLVVIFKWGFWRSANTGFGKSNSILVPNHHVDSRHQHCKKFQYVYKRK